jgi:hypothetical protein
MVVHALVGNAAFSFQNAARIVSHTTHTKLQWGQENEDKGQIIKQDS